MIIKHEGTRIRVEMSISEALEQQANLARAIAAALERRTDAFGVAAYYYPGGSSRACPAVLLTVVESGS